MSTTSQNILLGNFLFKYRGIIPSMLLMLGLITCYMELFTSVESFNAPQRSILMNSCFFLAVMGESIRIITVGYSPRDTSGRNADSQKASELNTTGLYSLTRNPLYLGNLLIWLSVSILTTNIIFIIGFLIFFFWFYLRIIVVEELYLSQKFGNKYEKWKSKTPRFWPKAKGFQKPVRRFNWKKVIRKEKNGVTAIFLAFSLFELIHQSITGEILTNSIWINIGLIGLFFYPTTKIIMRFTSWLDNSIK